MKLATQGHDRRVRLHEPPISEREPFLTRAERHLLREHRREVALLLCRSCVKALMRVEPATAMVHRSDDGPCQLRIPDEDWFLRKRANLTFRGHGEDFEEAQRLLDKSSSGAAHAAALAKLSTFISPRDETRLWLALCLSAQGLDDDSRLIALEILSHRPTPANASYAHQLLAWCHLARCSYDRAGSELMTAYRLGEGRASPLAAALHCAVLAQNEPSVIHLAALLSEHPSTSIEGVVDEHVSFWVARRRVGSFTPDPRSRDRAIAISDDLPPLARRVIRVFV
jgi:hypothetical protein